MNYDMKYLESSVSKLMDERRFIHTLGVKDTSFAMAIVHHYDEQQALVAGLLHDIAKCLPDEKLIGDCEEYGLPISSCERKSPYLLHGKLGAYYAKTRFGILDPNILSAITYHTTGKPDMNLLEKIVFVADFIEPGRSGYGIPNMKQIRELAFTNLDKAVFEILKSTITYLETKNASIDTTTIDAYQYYATLIGFYERS